MPYNSCYLPNEERVEPREINPVEMWIEDRWVLLRRVYGSELTQKLFIQCLTFIYTVNNVKGSYFHAIQDTIVRELFDQEPRDFFEKINKDTWVQ